MHRIQVTFSKFYFDAGYEQWILGGVTIVPKGFCTGEKFSVKWTGAVTDNAGTDSTRAIQKAIVLLYIIPLYPEQLLFPKGEGEYDHYVVYLLPSFAVKG